MTRIVVSGCNGKMGHEIVSIVSEASDCQVVAGIDIHTTGNEEFPVFSKAEDVSVDADVLVDFSHPSALSSLCLGKPGNCHLCSAQQATVRLRWKN